MVPRPAHCLRSRNELRTRLIGLNLPVLAKYKTDKPEHQQDGSGYHHPILIFHRREHAQLGTFFAFSPSSTRRRMACANVIS
jgi:hypothetical protein